MQSQMFDRAQDFIWRNARLIDRHLFAFKFLKGEKAPVIAALKAYQNADGGFGNALEADNRTPTSQPIAAEAALHYLDSIDALGDQQVQSDLLLPLCDWLQTVTTDEGGVPFVLPSANPYPHTPWMGCADDAPPAALNPTASLAGFLVKSGIKHPWLERAVPYCRQQIEKTAGDEYHVMLTEVIFLQAIPDRAWASTRLAQLVERARQPDLVEYDPDAGGYVHLPLDWAGHPDSPFRTLFDEATLRSHLGFLAKRQRADGGWPISWEPVSIATEMEWRAQVTIGALSTLQAFEGVGITPV